MKPEDKIKWTPELLNEFKQYFAYAQDEKEPRFTFHGEEFLTAYAKYLIDYLNQKFNN